MYDRPKRSKGRPQTCMLTDEERAQRKRDIAKQNYNDNVEYVRLQKQMVR